MGSACSKRNNDYDEDDEYDEEEDEEYEEEEDGENSNEVSASTGSSDHVVKATTPSKVPRESREDAALSRSIVPPATAGGPSAPNNKITRSNKTSSMSPSSVGAKKSSASSGGGKSDNPFVAPTESAPDAPVSSPTGVGSSNRVTGGGGGGGGPRMSPQHNHHTNTTKLPLGSSGGDGSSSSPTPTRTPQPQYISSSGSSSSPKMGVMAHSGAGGANSLGKPVLKQGSASHSGSFQHQCIAEVRPETESSSSHAHVEIDYISRLPRTLQNKVIRMVGAQLMHNDIVHPFAVEPGHLLGILNEIKGERTSEETFDLRQLFFKAKGVMAFKLKHINRTFTLDGIDAVKKKSKTFMKMQKDDVLYGCALSPACQGYVTPNLPDDMGSGTQRVAKTVTTRKRKKLSIPILVQEFATVVLFPSVAKKANSKMRGKQIQRPFDREALCVMTSGDDSNSMASSVLLPDLFINSSHFQQDVDKALLSSMRNMHIRLDDAYRRVTQICQGDAFGEGAPKPFVPADAAIVYVRNETIYAAVSGNSLTAVLFDIRADSPAFIDMIDSDFSEYSMDVSQHSLSQLKTSQVLMPPMNTFRQNLIYNVPGQKSSTSHSRSGDDSWAAEERRDSGFSPLGQQPHNKNGNQQRSKTSSGGTAGGGQPLPFLTTNNDGSYSIESFQGEAIGQSRAALASHGPGFVVVCAHEHVWAELSREEVWHFLATMIRKDVQEREENESWRPLGLPTSLDDTKGRDGGTKKLQNVNEDLANVLADEACRRIAAKSGSGTVQRQGSNSSHGSTRNGESGSIANNNTTNTTHTSNTSSGAVGGGAGGVIKRTSVAVLSFV